MSTANFYKTNASKYFVIEDLHEFYFEDTIDNISTELASECKKLGLSFWDKYGKSKDSTVLGTINQSFDFLGIDVNFSFLCVCRSGYYSGANFDFDYKIELGYDSFDSNDTLDEIYYSFLDRCEFKGLATIHKKLFIKKIANLISNTSELIENVYSEFTEQYVCSARFSNGEAIYSKVA
jgi:hypothetical protein